MAQTSRVPLEAKTQRISFQDEPENVEEEIVCRPQDPWANLPDWVSEVVIVPKTPKISLEQPLHLFDLPCSFPISGSLTWEYPAEPLDWTKVTVSLHKKLLSLWRAGSIEDTSLEKEFNALASRWYRETRKLSSADQMVLHPAYQQIIGMGRDALPLIFQELERTRGHWIWALSMIVRDDKAKPGMTFKEAVDAWLLWGEENDYI